MELLDIKGIGDVKYKRLLKLDINTVDDLLHYYPYRYFIIKNSDIRKISNNETVIISGSVERHPTITYGARSLKKINFTLLTNEMVFRVSAFNQTYLLHKLFPGLDVVVIGKYYVPNCIVASRIIIGKLNKPKIESIYHLTKDISNKDISNYIEALINTNYKIKSNLPIELIKKYDLLDIDTAIRQIHFPSDIISLKKARIRLKYEELYNYMYGIALLKKSIRTSVFDCSKVFDKNKIESFVNELPFTLTDDQYKSLEEIYVDLRDKKSMYRLLQGDVGSGKTVVAFIACYATILAGFQTSLMAPTELLAIQHYDNACKLFSKVNIKIEILTSKVKLNKKKEVLRLIALGKVDMVIGTHSLIQDNVEFYKLGLVITDEEHRFGVDQRNKLSKKGNMVDILSMSATPIPRTYALTVYNDMDVSSIKTKPSGRRDIVTIIKTTSEMYDVLKMMADELHKKHQIYVVTPAIENDDSVLDNVVNLEKKMQIAFGSYYRVSALHGQMRSEKKEKVLSEFQKGNIDILISTTIIEVGIDVKNASMIVIMGATNFGLSTLHQLRGRVGRGNVQSYCILVCENYCDKLNILIASNDGFVISEYDFNNRGEGDVFGNRQSGDLNFKLVNISRDYKMLVKVKEDVEKMFV
ncbi:MAG: ATP-dependent DNA helicase RecG [bacterium]|nr:ATP-dependent DNA helicase RecG [bacterium]